MVRCAALQNGCAEGKVSFYEIRSTSSGAIAVNRIDRLTAILLRLQEKKLSGEELAGQFEVSRRTIMRDVQALCEMGIPIVAEWGPNGGYSLLDFSLKPLPLSLREAFLLHLSLNTLDRSPRLTDPAIRQSLQAKVRSLIPHAMRETIGAMLEKVEVRSRGNEGRLAFFDSLLTVTQKGAWVRVDYTSMRGASTQLLQPQKLYLQDGFWYLAAYSHERGEDRIYRVDRISSLTAADPPTEGKRKRSSIGYGDPSLPEVVIALTKRGTMEVERSFAWGNLQKSDHGGELRLRCPPDEYPWLSRFVLGLATDAHVIAPPELARIVRREAQAVVQQYNATKNR